MNEASSFDDRNLPLGPDDEAHGKAYDGVALLHGNLGKNMLRLPQFSPHGFALLESILFLRDISRPTLPSASFPWATPNFTRASLLSVAVTTACPILLLLAALPSIPQTRLPHALVTEQVFERTPDEETAAETAENRGGGGG